MKGHPKVLVCLFVSFALGIGTAFANTTANQTDQLSTILPGSALPFRVVIEQANFRLPVGIHSGVMGVYKGLWVFIAGRINGLHGFGVDPFPPDSQNTSIYVVNPSTGVTVSRSLSDPSSGLSQEQIDTLSVTSPQGYQKGNTLYMSGGYGINTASSTYSTKPVLTAFYLPGIVKWVTTPGNSRYSVAGNIKQTYSSVFQVAGGKMLKIGKITQLIFGQNFSGVYTDISNGNYTDQVRLFKIVNNGKGLSANIKFPSPNMPNPNFRRRDLNVLPYVMNNNGLHFGSVAYAGVFTVAGGAWTVPVMIDDQGNPTMSDPNLPGTFKQGMNQYTSAAVSLHSRKNKSMYHLFLGGITYEYYQNGLLKSDAELPFTNEVTTVRMDMNGNFTQYIMDGQYPYLVSTGSNPGNQLLFGASAYFMPADIPHFFNGVIKMDKIHRPTVIGYVVGGIQSTLPNTNVDSDSAASPYVFRVTLVPTR